MREIIPDIDRWLEQGQSLALATVVQTWGSSPRRVGAKMAVTPAGQIAGSVSGGCVESAVVEAAFEVLKSGQPQLLHFGVSDEAAWEVGLACGGQIDVFVNPLDVALYQALRAALSQEDAFAVVTLLRGAAQWIGQSLIVRPDGGQMGRLPTEIAPFAVQAALRALKVGRSERMEIPEGEVFCEVYQPAPRLVMVGGVHIAVALAALARTLGYQTIVIDPRRAFGSPERFAHADRLIQAWPDEALAQIEITPNTAIVMLTHDPKLDDPALKIALPSPAFYVGALGSRKTQQARRERLLAAGVDPALLARLHGPIGLDIGAQTPEEIALAILAEVTAARNRKAALQQTDATPADGDASD
jgi:xanthine dehydrogenase accessory factor